MIIKNLSLAAMLLAGTAANATAVNVSFSGTFSTGERLTGTLTYETATNTSGENFVEFNNLITSLSVTSARFLTTTGKTTLTAIPNGVNKIRYGSGDLGVSPTSQGFNALQFLVNWSDVPDTSGYGYLPYLNINLSVPAYSFPVAALPSSFSISADSRNSIGLVYSHPTPSGGFASTDYLNLTSITAMPAIAAVPEPTTWGMMLIGFGLVGAASRRRLVLIRA